MTGGSWWERSGIAVTVGSFGAVAALFVAAFAGVAVSVVGVGAILILVPLGAVTLMTWPVVALVYAGGGCSTRALAWWSAGSALSCAMLAAVFSIGIWPALVALLGVVFFGGRVEGSRLGDDPAVASVMDAWRWVRAQEGLPRTWRWRLALGRAPWWFGLFAVLVVAAALAGLSFLAAAVPGGGGGGAAAVYYFPLSVVTLLASVPLFAALGAAVPLSVAAALLLVATQWFTDGVVLRGRADTDRALRLRSRLVHLGFDVVLVGVLFLPLALLTEERHGLENYAPWLALPPLFAARVLYVSVVAAGTEGSTAALRRTGWLVVRRPFDVARVLTVQAAGAAALAVIAVPLFAVVAVVASPLSLVAGVAHGVAWGAGGGLGTHATLGVAEVVLYCLVCAILAGRLVAPLLLWHTRHRVEFVRRMDLATG